MHELTPEQRKEVAALTREASIPYARIGGLYGITRQAVYRIAKRAGVSRNPSKGLHHIKAPMSPEDALRFETDALHFEEWCRANMRAARRYVGMTPARLDQYDRWMQRWIEQSESSRAKVTNR